MKEENRQDEEKLKDFLNKKPGDAADDFEKEALEGFAMLGDEKEIRDLKEKTDRKVAEALLAEESKAPVSRYWYAAAGLLLCIGLSVFFVTKNDKISEKDLAINQAPIKSEAGPAVPEEKQAPQESAPSVEKEETQKVVVLKNVDAVSSGPAFNKNVSSKDEAKSAKTHNESYEPKNDKTLSAEPVAYSGAGSGDVANTVAPAKPSQPSTAAVNQNTTEEDLNFAVKEDRAADMKTQAESLKEVEVVNRKSKAKSEAMKKTASDDVMAAPSAQIEAASAPSCYYAGGPKKLAKELKKELKNTGLDRTFTARLHINTQNQVEKAEVLTENTFTKQEKEELNKILKKLGKFSNTTKSTAVYTLEYTP